MSKIDWKDPEQVKAYNREYYAANREHIGEMQREWQIKSGYRERRKEARRNRPAGDGGKKKGRKTDGGFWDVAYCTENLHDELSWGIDKEKLRRSIEE